MPPAQTIVASLAEISRLAWPLALIWHFALFIAIVAVLTGWRPAQRITGVSLALPAISVALLALNARNPFNGVVFAALAIFCASVGINLSARPIHRGSRWSEWVGILLLAFAWVYPHFINFGLHLVWLYASPLGLIPCPTLCLLIGISLIGNGFNSRLWCFVLAAFGMFYGLFGAFFLGVAIDVVLIAGALAIGVLGAVGKMRTWE